MAKFEDQGYCPDQWLDFSTDNRLKGLWSLIGSSVVYQKEDFINTVDIIICNKVFSSDVIAYDVISSIIKKNVNASKILVHQLRNSYYTQNIADIKKVLEKKDSQLIAHAGSNFIVVITDASYGIDVYIWDLSIC